MKNCRVCGSEELRKIIGLGHQPPSNKLLQHSQLDKGEAYYPLDVYACENCSLIQIDDFKISIFNAGYPYYSSQSPSNVENAKVYVKDILSKFPISSVLEIGSNDGYMLKEFAKHPHIKRIRGVDPALGPCTEARSNGIETDCAFFNPVYAMRELNEGTSYDLICGINVLAHQPSLNDFITGMEMLLTPDGIITMEFPHAINLIMENQFDTIYHEHYSYLTLKSVSVAFILNNLRIFDAEEIGSHGGSLRIYACKENAIYQKTKRYLDLRFHENNINIEQFYEKFENRVQQLRKNFMGFIYNLPGNAVIAGYGAAAKGNTFLNYCGLHSDIIKVVVDKSPYKTGKYLPGSHIPIVNKEWIMENKPNYILILPWNIKGEIVKQLEYIREWGGKFIVAIPELEVI